MTTDFNQAFDTLLSTWRAHQELRERQASFAELADSKNRLSQARANAARARRR